MNWTVCILKKAQKYIEKAPAFVGKKFAVLVHDLQRFGPLQPSWPHYRRLENGAYHCHLPDKWVAVWRADRESLTVEVYYAGSRESAPY